MTHAGNVYAAGWLRKTPRTEKPAVCLSRRVKVSRRQHRPRGSDTGKTLMLLAWLARRGIVAGKIRRGLCTQAAAILDPAWRPTKTCCDSWPWPLTFWPQNKWVSMTHCGHLVSFWAHVNLPYRIVSYNNSLSRLVILAASVFEKSCW